MKLSITKNNHYTTALIFSAEVNSQVYFFLKLFKIFDKTTFDTKKIKINIRQYKKFLGQKLD